MLPCSDLVLAIVCGEEFDERIAEAADVPHPLELALHQPVHVVDEDTHAARARLGRKRRLVRQCTSQAGEIVVVVDDWNRDEGRGEQFSVGTHMRMVRAVQQKNEQQGGGGGATCAFIWDDEP